LHNLLDRKAEQGKVDRDIINTNGGIFFFSSSGGIKIKRNRNFENEHHQLYQGPLFGRIRKGVYSHFGIQNQL
jgi:hypothetical protein